MSRCRFLFSLSVIVSLLGCGPALARAPTKPKAVVLNTAPDPEPETEPAADPPASQPTTRSAARRLDLLRRLVQQELDRPEMARARVSLLVEPLAKAPEQAQQAAGQGEGGGAGRRRPTTNPPASMPTSMPTSMSTSMPASAPVAIGDGSRDPLVSVEPDARRVPASNAKLLTSLAALKVLPGRYGFVTEVYRRGTRLYLHGTGDPVLRGRELESIARRLRARGVGVVTGVVIDDSRFDRRRRLAPGFERFSEGAYYRPTSGALNVNGNAIVIKVSGPRDRRRPRVDVVPPSDYVKVRKLVRYTGKQRRGRPAPRTRISVRIRPRGSIMWVTISGQFRRGDRMFRTRRAVYDPGLAAGWALRRGLVKAGVQVSGSVWRGRRPRGARPLIRKVRSLGAILAAVNTHSDNLAAETLVRAMGSLDPGAPRGGSWPAGLNVLKTALDKLGLTGFWLGNGSGLHRKSWVTTELMVALLRTIHADERLRRTLVPTLAVAGRSGTLRGRLRGTAAEGVVLAKTGTLGGALALSGYVDPTGKQPLVFSLIVNGRSDRAVRDGMDRIAALLARYSRGLFLEAPGTQPVTPATQPATQPASQPVQ
jgi:D-alanyl-D-alanine carboxypeptidase/D-alanyl-D-alanine-endopeptidase (penicillin-binding protein 4)